MNFLKRLFELLFKKKQPEETKNDLPILGDPIFVPSKPVDASARWIEVHPTGVKGQGKVRLYPNPTFVMNYENKPVETITGYASQTQEIWGCRHYDFRRLGNPMYQTSFIPASPAQFPETLDRAAYAEDWLTQEELDRRTAEQKRDNEIAKGGKDSFLSSQEAKKPNDEEDIPISNG